MSVMTTNEIDAETTTSTYDTAEYKLLYSAVLADPESDVRRRELADWIRPRDPERAEIIYAQLLLEKVDRQEFGPDAQRRKKAKARRKKMMTDAELLKAMARDRRADERCLKAHNTVNRLAKLVAKWYPRPAPLDVVDTVPRDKGTCGVMLRGFVDEVVVPTLDLWHEIGLEVCRLHPVTRVTIRTDSDGKPFKFGTHERQRTIGEMALLATRRELAAKI